MKPDKRVIVAELIIILIWLLDSEYLGLNKSEIFRQIFHVVAAFSIALTGYITWRKKERWVCTVWIWVYTVVLFLILIMGLLLFNGIQLSETARLNIWNIRLFFTSPLPFMALYVLYLFYSRRIIKK